MTGVAVDGDLRRLLDLAGRWRRRPVVFSDSAAGAVEALVNEIAARRAAGGDVLATKVYGGSIPELHAAALLEAAELWGPEGSFTVEATATVFTASSGRGRFFATVTVRCLNYAEVTP